MNPEAANNRFVVIYKTIYWFEITKRFYRMLTFIFLSATANIKTIHIGGTVQYIANNYENLFHLSSQF